MTRRKLLASVPALGAVTAAYAFGIEPNWFELVVQPVNLPGLGGRARVLQLSDLHASFESPLSTIQAAVELGLRAKPDLICVTGDFVTREEPLDMTRYARILRMLSDTAPTFGTLGNHDGGYWAAANGSYADTNLVVDLLGASGVPLMHNRSKLIQVGSARFHLVGVGDLWSAGVDGDQAFRDTTSGAPTVLLAHNPDTKGALWQHHWDLMLSGHTHGGQVLVPLMGDGYLPVHDKRYVSGLKPWHDRQIYVTRGVGRLNGVRFRCRPEVTILDLNG